MMDETLQFKTPPTPIGSEDPAHVIETRFGPDDRFEAKEYVAKGGFGWVYKAWDHDFRAWRALKIMHAPEVGDFEREARLANALARRPGAQVGMVHGFGRDHEGRPWMALEWMGEDNLRDYLKRDRRRFRDPKEFWNFVEQVSKTLEKAHRVQLARSTGEVEQADLVHCDLKPENVMVEEDPASGELSYTVLDFGIASAVSIADTHATITLRMQPGGGTLEYMSPEQTRAEEPTRKVDMYSFGVMLYELLVGRVPFKQEGRSHLAFAECMRSIAKENPPRFTELADDLPEWALKLEPVVRRCLEKDPADRPEYEELRAAIRAVLFPEPEVPVVPRWAVAASVSLVAAVLVLGAFLVPVVPVSRWVVEAPASITMASGQRSQLRVDMRSTKPRLTSVQWLWRWANGEGEAEVPSDSVAWASVVPEGFRARDDVAGGRLLLTAPRTLRRLETDATVVVRTDDDRELARRTVGIVVDPSEVLVPEGFEAPRDDDLVWLNDGVFHRTLVTTLPNGQEVEFRLVDGDHLAGFETYDSKMPRPWPWEHKLSEKDPQGKSEHYSVPEHPFYVMTSRVTPAMQGGAGEATLEEAHEFATNVVGRHVSPGSSFRCRVPSPNQWLHAAGFFDWLAAETSPVAAERVADHPLGPFRGEYVPIQPTLEVEVSPYGIREMACSSGELTRGYRALKAGSRFYEYHGEFVVSLPYARVFGCCLPCDLGNVVGPLTYPQMFFTSVQDQSSITATPLPFRVVVEYQPQGTK